MKTNALIARLSNAQIKYIHLKPQNKFIVYAQNKAKSMTWGMFQLHLKVIAKFNQNNLCVCGKKLGIDSELHHAILSRRKVQGNKKCENLIHSSLNVIEICKSCHISITKKESVNFLANIFGNTYISEWYNMVDSYMKSDLEKIDYYLPNWCSTCGKQSDDKFCSRQCSEYEDLK